MAILYYEHNSNQSTKPNQTRQNSSSSSKYICKAHYIKNKSLE